MDLQDKRSLLSVAAQSLRYGLEHHQPLPVRAQDYAPALRKPRASFVTLTIDGALRGCIGSLEPIRPVIEDVAYNAYSAGFRDPRFPPLQSVELAHLHIHISLLTIPEPLQVSSEEELVHRLRPGVDGLILQEGTRRGTFLPSVWDSLPTAREFLRHLKLKAGLPPDYWSDTLRFQRYTAEAVEAEN